MRATKSFEERLERYIERIPEAGCWIWTGATLSNGYGKFRDANMKSALAHRATYEYYKGKIDADKYVCHTCDVPSCVNPNHLFAGTPTENQQDSKSKGRMKKAKFKLDRKTVDQIMAQLKLGASQREISYMYSISQSMVSMIKTRKVWQ